MPARLVALTVTAAVLTDDEDGGVVIDKRWVSPVRQLTASYDRAGVLRQEADALVGDVLAALNDQLDSIEEQ